MRAPGLLLGVVLFAHAADAEIVLRDHGARARWGASAELGTHAGWGGVQLRGEVRLGYQVSRQFSLFGIAAFGGGVSGVYGFGLDFGAVAEFMPVDWLFLGAGLVASYGHTSIYEYPPTGPSYARYDLQVGFRPALDLRAGFSTGKSLPPWFSRGGFDIGLHALLVLHPEMTRVDTTVFSNSPPRRGTALFIFTPMITVGFDFR